MKCFTIPVVVAAVAFLGNVILGQEPSGIPENIIKELDSFVGTWRVEGKIGDKEVTGTCTLRWVRTEDDGKICLSGRGTFQIDGKTQHVATLMGWNAANKCIEDRGFDAEGGSGINYWTVTSPGTWQGEIRRVNNGREVESRRSSLSKVQRRSFPKRKAKRAKR